MKKVLSLFVLFAITGIISAQGQQGHAAPGKKKWDKAKWQVEWKAMNARCKSDSFWKNAWNCVVSAYKGSGWVATLTDPAATALYSWETQKIGDWLDDIHSTATTTAGSSQPKANATAAPSSPSSPSTPSQAHGNIPKK